MSITRVLIVDDEAIARRLMMKTLAKAGFEVEQAANGEEAWEMLRHFSPDAMITDIDMPRMTGEELCQKISIEMPERTFPIIVVTSKTALEHRTWARQLANLSFIEKPLSLRKLIDRLHLLMSDPELAEESR